MLCTHIDQCFMEEKGSYLFEINFENESRKAVTIVFSDTHSIIQTILVYYDVA